MVSLPSGTVTFLFTDIEGSTRLMEELGDRYGDVLQEHRRVLREELGGAGGQEIDTQGDAFFFSFARARDAIAGAVAAQRALAAHDWPHGARVRVRMGLHTGEPTVGDEGYHGLDVVRAARICSAAHGGQIFVSETTQALAGTALPEGVAVRDLGEQPLKDIKPERVFQLVVDREEAEGAMVRSDATAELAARPDRPSRADALGAAWEHRLNEQIEGFVHSQLERAFARRGERFGRAERAELPARTRRPPEARVVPAALGGLLIAAVAVLGLGAVVVALVLLVKLAF